MTSTSSSSSTIMSVKPSNPPPIQPPPSSPRRIPVTPAVLRSIFASSRTPHEERSISRVAFFRFVGFLLSCVGISLTAAKCWGIKSGAGLLAY